MMYGFCSIRCAIAARHGRPSSTPRTECAGCSAPLTKPQQWRRREFCSKSCAKSSFWSARPDAWARITAKSHRVQRAHFVERLRRFLAACPSNEAAYDRGFGNGRRVAWGRAAQAGRQVQRPRVANNTRPAQRAAALVGCPSKAEAFRIGYRLGFEATLWRFGYAPSSSTAAHVTHHKAA